MLPRRLSGVDGNVGQRHINRLAVLPRLCLKQGNRVLVHILPVFCKWNFDL